MLIKPRCIGFVWVEWTADHRLIPFTRTPTPQTTMSSRHGDADGIVRYSWGQHSAEKLKELGVDKYRFETYRVRGGLCERAGWWWGVVGLCWVCTFGDLAC